MNSEDQKSKQSVKKALSPADFTEILKSIPADVILIGGQAIAIWASHYDVNNDVTSKDIDFWGSVRHLDKLARMLNAKVYKPNQYEMTWLAGSISTIADGQQTRIELLHDVPGLDNKDPSLVAIPYQNTTGIKITVLTPVSLLLTKLYAIRHFDQTERHDLEHLKIAIKASHGFIYQTCGEDTRLALWNCNRVIKASKEQKHQELENEQGFRLLDAIPIEKIRELAEDNTNPDHEKWANFVKEQWSRTIGQALSRGIKNGQLDTINTALGYGAKPQPVDFAEASGEVVKLLLKNAETENADEAKQIAKASAHKAPMEIERWLKGQLAKHHCAKTLPPPGR